MACRLLDDPKATQFREPPTKPSGLQSLPTPIPAPLIYLAAWTPTLQASRGNKAPMHLTQKQTRSANAGDIRVSVHCLKARMFCTGHSGPKCSSIHTAGAEQRHSYTPGGRQEHPATHHPARSQAGLCGCSEEQFLTTRSLSEVEKQVR